MSKKTSFYDYNLIAVILLLTCFGLVMLYSTSAYTAEIEFGDLVEVDDLAAADAQEAAGAQQGLHIGKRPARDKFTPFRADHQLAALQVNVDDFTLAQQHQLFAGKGRHHREGAVCAAFDGVDDVVDLRRDAIRVYDDLRVGAGRIDLYVDVDAVFHNNPLFGSEIACRSF